MKGKVASEFARQPRTLNELDRRKATDLRSFLLYIGPNVHGLIDIADDVEYFKKSLQAISAFAFENSLQELKRFVRSRHIPVTQIMKHLGELEGLSREQ